MIILDFGNIGKKKGAHMALLKLSGGRQYNRMIQVRVKMQIYEANYRVQFWGTTDKRPLITNIGT